MILNSTKQSTVMSISYTAQKNASNKKAMEEREKAGRFTLIVFLLSCSCLLHVATGCYAVCDYGFPCSYSLTFLQEGGIQIDGRCQTGALWFSGRVLNSRRRGCGDEPYRRHCLMSFSKTH